MASSISSTTPSTYLEVLATPAVVMPNRRATDTCPVGKSLHPEVKVNLEMRF
ncbi:MAG: hypothetical protein KBT67_06285 [bacterium]|nr:hypothetical protein [Candidatus Limimorpha caballi]